MSNEAFINAVKDEKYAYCRARSWRLSGYVKDNSDYVVYCYHRDPKSPTGVSLAAAMSDLDAAAKVLDECGRPFPLSPTEGLKKH